MLKKIRRAAGVVLPTFLLVGCPQESAIWVAPGSTADSLTFIVGHKRGQEAQLDTYLRVWECRSPPAADTMPPLWEAGVVGSRVVFGRSGPGIDARRAPEALRPGCYNASVSGTGAARFIVEEDGRVREIPRRD